MRHSDNEFKVKKFFEEGQAAFIKACEVCGIKPSRRQAAKWLMKKGLAYKFRGGVN